MFFLIVSINTPFAIVSINDGHNAVLHHELWSQSVASQLSIQNLITILNGFHERLEYPELP